MLTASWGIALLLIGPQIVLRDHPGVNGGPLDRWSAAVVSLAKIETFGRLSRHRADGSEIKDFDTVVACHDREL
jgi:hypothetical protein